MAHHVIRAQHSDCIASRSFVTLQLIIYCICKIIWRIRFRSDFLRALFSRILWKFRNGIFSACLAFYDIREATFSMANTVDAIRFCPIFVFLVGYSAVCTLDIYRYAHFATVTMANTTSRVCTAHPYYISCWQLTNQKFIK